MLIKILPPVLLFALQLVFIYFIFSFNLCLETALAPDSSQASCLLSSHGLCFYNILLLTASAAESLLLET